MLSSLRYKGAVVYKEPSAAAVTQASQRQHWQSQSSTRFVVTAGDGHVDVAVISFFFSLIL